ncbi:MAG: XdhC family protein, partial [Deltaproteobacteria bacterium]
MQRGRDGLVGHVSLAIELLEELCDAIHERTPAKASLKACVRARRQTGATAGPVGNRTCRPLESAPPGVPVKHWVETAAILDRLSKLIAGGHSAALATVVRISGSAYRRPGAKLLVEEDGTMQGGVSGGCLENDVRALALEVLRGGASRMLHYDTGSDEETLWGLGLGCEGAVDVYLQRIGTGWVDAAG